MFRGPWSLLENQKLGVLLKGPIMELLVGIYGFKDQVSVVEYPKISWQPFKQRHLPDSNVLDSIKQREVVKSHAVELASIVGAIRGGHIEGMIGQISPKQ